MSALVAVGELRCLGLSKRPADMSILAVVHFVFTHLF